MLTPQHCSPKHWHHEGAGAKLPPLRHVAGLRASPQSFSLSTRALAALALVTLTTLVLTHTSPPAFAATDWEQVGVDIDGEAAGSEAGYSVALSDDGTTLAVGEWRNTGPLGANQGQVRVYELAGGVIAGFRKVLTSTAKLPVTTSALL